VKVEFLGPIGLDSITLDAYSLRELSNELLKIEGLEKWLNNSAVAVNDELVKDIDFVLKDGDTISILPPVCGG